MRGVGHGNFTEKILSENRSGRLRKVLGIVHFGGAEGIRTTQHVRYTDYLTHVQVVSLDPAGIKKSEGPSGEWNCPSIPVTG